MRIQPHTPMPKNLQKENLVTRTNCTNRLSLRNSTCFVAGLLIGLGVTPRNAGAQAVPRPAVVPVSQPSAAVATLKANALANYGALPLRFEANDGQVNGAVKFLSRGQGYTLFLTGDEAVLRMTKSDPPTANTALDPNSKARSGNTQDSVVRMKLVGANTSAAVTGAEELPSKSNYFLGNDPTKWRSNVSNYSRVKYESVYPGVDLVYYGNQSGHLEYDFVVAPGADPNVINLNFVASGAGKSRLRVAANGDLVVKTASGDMSFQKPVLYQPASNNAGGTSSSESRTPIEGRYILKANHHIGFQVASYDHTRPLYIDPVLVYSTYLGGSKNDYGLGIAVDSTGNAYITGYTTSADFPVTSGALLTSCPTLCAAGIYPAFVAKMNATGKSLIYATYLGSTTQGYAIGSGIAVDSLGNAYIAGTTSSASFPVTAGAFQTTNHGTGVNQIVGFVTKLNPTGSALVYSTYLGASNFVNGDAIAIDSTGNAYITGMTQAGDFPTLHPVQATFGGVIGSSSNVFVTELNPTGTALVFSTYLGGGSSDQGNGIFADNSGNVYVGGYTTSSDFPVLHSYDAYPAGVSGMADAFVAKLNWNGTSLVLVYSTLLGDTNSTTAMASQGNAIAVDPSGNVYLTGWTNAADFPTSATAYQKTYAGGGDTFVSKLSWNGSTLSLPYSTFLGGSGQDHANAIAIDPSGNAYVVGTTLSTNFPTLNAIVPTSGGGYYAFVTELNPTGSALVYSTYLGGANPSGYGTSGYGIALDVAGNAYVTGNTGATNFPTTTSPLQATCGGCSAGNVTVFVSKLPTSTVAPSAGLSPSTLSFGNQNLLTTSASQPVTLSNTGTAALAISNISVSGYFGQTNNCGSSLAIGASCTINVTFSPTTVGGPLTGTLTVTDNSNLVANSTQNVSLSGTGIVINAATLSPATIPFGNQPINTTSSTAGVAVLTNTGNVPLTSIVVSVTGTNASAFAAFSGCGSSIAVGASCNINVNFTPTTLGTNTATLSVADSATGSPQTVSLTGTGVNTSVVAPLPLSFNPAAVGISSSSAQTITASFTVNGYAAGFTPTATLHYGTSFSIGAINCTGTVNSETCSVPVTFQPQYPGARKDAVVLMNGTSIISTLLVGGVGQAPFALVQPGVLTQPILNGPTYYYQSAVGEDGTVYVVSSLAGTIYKVTSAGVVTALQIAGLSTPHGVAVDGAGTLYIVQNGYNKGVVTYTTGGVQGLIADAPPTPYVPCSNSNNGALSYLYSVAVDQTGNLFTFELLCNQIFKLSPNGTYTTTTLNPSMTQPSQLTVDSADNVFVSGYAINELTAGGVQTQINTSGASDGLGVDAADTLYATRYSPTGGVGLLPASGYATALTALDTASSPLGASVGPDGTVYVGNYTNVDKIDRSQGVVDFGSLSSGVASTPKTLSIYNGGNQPLTISNITIAGTGYALQAATTSNCTNPIVIAPGALCQFNVILTPPHAGTFTGSVTIASNSLNNTNTTQTISLTGIVYGAYLTESPATLTFSPQIVNTTSASQTATLTNNGLLYSAGLNGPTSSSPAYAIGLGTCSAGIAPGASCNLSITFTPTAAQTYNNVTITVPYYSSGGGASPPPITFTVNGTGTPAPTPQAVLSPNPLAFPSTTVNTPAATLPMTLSNPGAAALSITGISVTGSNASSFSQTNNCGTSLAAGATCTITVTFTPASTGSLSASISVADNATGSPHTAALTGTGIKFVSNVGTALAAQPVTLNIATAGTLSAIQVFTQGTPNLDFTIGSGGTCTTTTAYTVGQSCTINVIFSPQAPGARLGALVLTDSSHHVLATTYLPGNGVAPLATFSLAISNTSQVTNILPSGYTHPPAAIAVDTAENVYYTLFGSVYMLPWSGSAYGAPVNIGGGYSFGLGLNGIAVDGAGNVFVADSSNSKLVEISWSGSAYGTPTAISLGGYSGSVTCLAIDGAGDIYFGDFNGTQVLELPRTTSGFGAPVVLPFTGSHAPYGVAVDTAGNVYMSDGAHNTILELPVTASGWGTQVTVGTVLGSIGQGLKVDPAGDVFATVTNASVNNSPAPVEFAWNGTSWGFPTPVYPTLSPLVDTSDFAFDSRGNIYQADANIGIRKLDWVDPPSLSFATTNVGSVSSDSPKNVSVANIGSAPLILSSGTNPGYPTDFPKNTSTPSPCTAGENLTLGSFCYVSINFKPTISGPLSENVALVDNNLYASGGATQNIVATGTGNPAAVPQANLTPNPLSFPGTLVGTSATALPMTLSNPGGAALTITSISVTGTNASSFGQSNTCGTSLAAGASCTITVTFTPSAAGSLAAAISVVDNATGSPHTAVLTGTGTSPQATVTSTTLTFVGTLVGTTAGTASTTLSNPGTAPLSISGITISGTNATSFAQTNTCGGSLAAGATCNITVTFTPASVGSLSATLSIADNATGSPQTVALSGTGTAPQAVLSPNPLAFPSTTVGTAATALPMTLSNPGTAPLSITSISVTGTNASSFGQSNNCGASLAAGASCTITVTFTPTTATALTAAISVTDSASGSPHSATITGTGTPPLIPQAALSPNPLTFSSTTINTSSMLPMTLSNPGNAPLTISSISVTGANASNFTETNTCGSSLAAGANCTITVTFTPTTAATLTAAISVADNAAGSPQSAVITGTGSAGTFVVNAPTSTANVQPGAVAQFNLTVAPIGGSYNNLVTLSATGLPAGATYSFSPPAVTPGTTGASSVLSIQTATGLARLRLPETQRRPPAPLLAVLAGVPLLGLAGSFRRLRKSTGKWLLLTLAMLAILPMLAISGCGGGYFGPAPQTYTINVVGTSGALQQTTTITLTVQ